MKPECSAALSKSGSGCHLFRGSPVLLLQSWKGYCCPTIIKYVRSEFYLRPRYSGHGDKAINIISSPHPDSMGSRVVVVTGDDHNGLKWTDLNQLVEVTRSQAETYTGLAAIVCPPGLTAVLQQFPAKALREELGLIDSDILFPILFSYLFHTLKVFPPLPSLSPRVEKSNRLWLCYLDMRMLTLQHL